MRSRYGKIPQRHGLPELRTEVVDLAYAEEEGESFTTPVHVALIDLDGGEAFLEIVKSSVLAALEALHPAALFGLATFSQKVTLHRVDGAGPPSVSVQVSDREDGKPLLGDLDAALPLEHFLVPVGRCKEQIGRALDALEGKGGGEGPNPLDVGGKGGRRALGPALEACIAYLAGHAFDDNGMVVDPFQDGGGLVSGNLMVFLGGAPDFGRGALGIDRRMATGASLSDGAESSSDTATDLLQPGADFYRRMGERAAAYGISCDLWALSGDYLDLASLEALPAHSGGWLHHSRSPEESQMPQELFRKVAQPKASSCSLRLRTSPEFRVARYYGNLMANAKYEDLYHVASCCPSDTYGFDFEYVGRGFNGDPDCPPALQVAFQYTVLVPRAEAGEADDVDSLNVGSHLVQRRLRVISKQTTVAKDQMDCYESTSPSAVLSLLAHKVIKASLHAGLEEAKSLVQDWLVILVSNYNLQLNTDQFTAAVHSGGPIDCTFANAASLQPMPRLIYGMLRSVWLRASSFADSGRVDERAYLLHLLRRLPPAAVSDILYPAMESFADPDKPGLPKHSLSRAALVASGSPIFLLDAFFHLVVYYAPGAADLPFPPPQQSALRAKINAKKAARSIMPKLHVLRGGVDDCKLFEECLIEEPAFVSVDSVDRGFPAFIDSIAQGVRAYAAAER